MDCTDGVLARIAGAGSGECGWIRVVIVVEDALGDAERMSGGDDEEMKEQDRHNSCKARQALPQAPARTSFAAYK